MNTCNLSTDTQGLGVYEASLSYVVRLCLIKNEQTKPKRTFEERKGYGPALKEQTMCPLLCIFQLTLTVNGACHGYSEALPLL
jgi:hypothetical protein